MAHGHVTLTDDGGEVSSSGAAFLGAFGIDCASVAPSRRLFCKPCLDWTVRRVHLAGRLGAALACRCFEIGWLVRRQGSRGVEVTEAGAAGLRARFDCDIARPLDGPR